MKWRWNAPVSVLSVSFPSSYYVWSSPFPSLERSSLQPFLNLTYLETNPIADFDVRDEPLVRPLVDSGRSELQILSYLLDCQKLFHPFNSNLPRLKRALVVR